MEYNKCTIFCHIENGANRVVYEPKHFLLVAERKDFRNSPNLERNNVGRPSIVYEKVLESDIFVIRAGNSASRFNDWSDFIMPYDEQVYTNILNWLITPSNVNKDKYYIVAEISADKKFLSLAKQTDYDEFGYHRTLSPEDFDHMRSNIETFDCRLASKVDAVEWTISYFPSSSNNTYLLHTKININNQARMAYLSLDTSVAGEAKLQVIYDQPGAGSVWGFGEINI